MQEILNDIEEDHTQEEDQVLAHHYLMERLEVGTVRAHLEL